MADVATTDNSTIDSIFEHLSNVPDDKAGEKPDSNVDKSKSGNDADEESEEINLDAETDDEEIEEEEEKEIKLEDEEEKEENELELAKIPTGKAIKEAYPDIFKKFPALEHIFYREKAYSEIFTSVKDAKAARAEIDDYKSLQSDLLNGDISTLLTQVKNTDPKAFNKIAANVLESLSKVDDKAILEPSRIILKSTIHNLNMLAAASLKKDPENKRAQQLQIATELIHEAIFNTSEVSAYERAVEERENPEKAAIAKERAELDNRKFGEAHSKVTTRFTDLLSKAIDKNVDPRNVLSNYVKSKVADDIRSELDKQLISDKRFEGIVKKLYERARSENYSQASLDNILTALKNKAASILPEIIRAKKGEALKGSSNRKESTKPRELSRQEEDESDNASTRSSRNSKSTDGKGKKEEGPNPGESAFDYLSRKLGDS